jgi:hypothetical protein
VTRYYYILGAVLAAAATLATVPWYFSVVANTNPPIGVHIAIGTISFVWDSEDIGFDMAPGLSVSYRYHHRSLGLDDIVYSIIPKFPNENEKCLTMPWWPISAWFVLYVSYREIRRQTWKVQRRCQHCGYSVLGHGKCSECGRATSDVARLR